MDDQQRQAFKVALEAALRERGKIDSTIEFLTEKLGIGAIPQVLTQGEGGTLPAEARDVGPLTVTEGEFFGMSSAKAARIVLERAGRSRPMKTDELFANIARGGVRLAGRHAKATFYRTLNHDPQFTRVSAGRWGLSEWYGGRATPKRTKNGAAPEGELETPDLGDAGNESPNQEDATDET